MPSTAGISTPSDHGPSGRSAVKTTHPRALNITLTITWKRPSWKRIVGANTPPGVGE